ncbi:extracellular solute-binding protein [Leptotrichia sp. OH3620_COT-345]|uniref:extracellular solute-binding protein n=1 Tax=Leptotrichia sp. OH3620_COT-345 TaxID=2491048 RepID=UPI000F651CC1|nr:extracellular solute-binding protein [Leptotrichia sp. OH3620_COT-345]RRD40161.1 extracellular solute-binding protein [Leptotrichia sp. OH3620_COT-345]
MKKVVYTLIIMTVLLSACGKPKEKTEIKGEDKKLEGYLISEKPKELTVFAIHLGKALDPELPVYKKAAEMTNIKLKNVASQNQTDQKEAYNLLVSSGELPDIVAYEFTEDLEGLGIDGGLIPLEELIDKYAPNIKKFWEENPRYKQDAIAADGHIYMIPNYYDYFNFMPSTGYYIRKDWIQKLGLQEPKTVEELHNVLAAFAEKDPNGNGKKDEVPIFSRGDTVAKVLQPLSDIFKARAFWYDSNEMVKFGPAQGEYKEAMKQLAKWYKEGLIDKEIFTRGISARDYMLSNNLGGFTVDWFGSTSSYNGKLEKTIPGFNFGIIAPPVFNGDNKTYQARTTYLGGWGISSKSKNAIEAIKYFDFWYSSEGRRLWNFGIEGDDYTVVDGKAVFTDKIMKNSEGKTPLAVIRESGAQFRLGMPQDSEYEKQWYVKEAVDAIDFYLKNNYVHELMPILKYTKEESKEFIKINTQLNSYVEEMSQKWIMGVSDVEKDWDMYVKRLNDIGLVKAEKIQESAYKRFMKK